MAAPIGKLHPLPTNVHPFQNAWQQAIKKLSYTVLSEICLITNIEIYILLFVYIYVLDGVEDMKPSKGQKYIDLIVTCQQLTSCIYYLCPSNEGRNEIATTSEYFGISQLLHDFKGTYKLSYDLLAIAPDVEPVMYHFITDPAHT
uniref:Uncharacterized protein n=1 Tax=Glossina brevipalpis TaxID=37001 RepID=A0A1A9WA38_9MUSC